LAQVYLLIPSLTQPTYLILFHSVFLNTVKLYIQLRSSRSTQVKCSNFRQWYCTVTET